MDFQIKPQVKKPVPVVKTVLAVDTDESESAVDIRKEAARCHNMVQDATYALLAEDPTACAYDAVYDEMKGKRERPKDAGTGPKYIPAMREAALLKTREQSILRERAESKERRKEEGLVGETERIYTPSYLKLLEENKALEERILSQEKRAELHSIAKQKDTSAFFAHFLEKTTRDSSEPPLFKKPKLLYEAKEPKVEIVSAPEPDVSTQQEIKPSEVQIPEAKEVEKEAKKSDSALDSARQRYLQRKKQTEDTVNSS